MNTYARTVQTLGTASLGGRGALSAPCISDAAISDYIALLKPRVMSLVIFTGLVGIVVAPGDVHIMISLTALLCIAVGAGAAGALNMWYDADIDARMQRTCKRPIPTGKVSPDEALTFGMVLSVGSVLTMAVLVNYVAASLLAFTIVFYVAVYTMWLKRRTPQNIVIGGASGALPPMIGWAAVTGGISFEPFILFLIIFMWTPPHFWALSLYRAGDYEKAGVPMLPVVAGKAHTRLQIVAYALALIPVAVAPYWLAFAGPLYLAVAVAASAGLAWHALRVWQTGRAAESAATGDRAKVKSAAMHADHAARKLFRFSLFYLFALFATLLIERGLGL